MKPSRLCLVGAAVVALTATPASRAAPRAVPARSPCANLSRGIPRGATVASGTHAHVALGAVVFVLLVEPAKYSGDGYPSNFPWLSAKSSSPSVLRPIPLCPSLYPTSLTLTVSAFRADRPGQAYLSAPLAKAWRKAPQSPFAAYRAVVFVGTRH
jgi:hypothetical protein